MIAKYRKKIPEANQRYQMPLTLITKIKNVKSQYKGHNLKYPNLDLRQNQLNSKFLKRKRRLQDISKQNKNIYVKINTQKSFYQNQQLNKSYRSSSQISKRLSRLKAQSRQSSVSRASRVSRKVLQNKNCKYNPKNIKPFSCQTIDINRIQNQNINNIKSLFVKPKTSLNLISKINQRKTLSVNLKNYKKKQQYKNFYDYDTKNRLPLLNINKKRQIIERSADNILLERIQKSLKNESYLERPRRDSLFEKRVQQILCR